MMGNRYEYVPFLVVTLCCWVLIVLLMCASGCHIHLLGRYYVGEQQDTVLLETNDEETERDEDDFRVDGNRSDSDRTLIVTEPY